MDVHLVRILERVLTAQEPDRVAADGRRGTDRDDAPRQVRDVDGLRDRVRGSQQRNAELDEPRPDGDVDPAGERRAATVIADDDLARDPVAGDDPLMGEGQVDVVRARAEEEGDRHDEQQRRDRSGDHPLDPAEGDPEHESRRGRQRDEHARRAHGARGPVRRGPDRPSRSARDVAVAHTASRTSVRPRVRGATVRVVSPAPEPVAAAERVRRDSVRAHTASRREGGATSSSTWPTTASWVTPSNSASGCRMSRCESVETVSAFTSSGVA